MNRVRLEVLPWLSRYFGAESTARAILERDVATGVTVGGFLEDMTLQSQELKEVLFDDRTGRLVSHIIVIKNGRLLELSGGLEAELEDGDTLRLMASIAGG